MFSMGVAQVVLDDRRYGGVIALEKKVPFVICRQETFRSDCTSVQSDQIELNYLRMNYRFEKIKLFHCMNFR